MDDPRTVKFVKYSVFIIMLTFMAGLVLHLTGVIDARQYAQFVIMFGLGGYVPMIVHLYVYKKHPEEESED